MPQLEPRGLGVRIKRYNLHLHRYSASSRNTSLRWHVV
jgi:hypothetical protein